MIGMSSVVVFIFYCHITSYHEFSILIHILLVHSFVGEEARQSLAASSAQGLTRLPAVGVLAKLHSLLEFGDLCQAQPAYWLKSFPCGSGTEFWVLHWLSTGGCSQVLKATHCPMPCGSFYGQLH